MDYEVIDIETGNVLEHHGALADAIDSLVVALDSGEDTDTLAVISWIEGQLQVHAEGSELRQGVFVARTERVAYIGQIVPRGGLLPRIATLSSAWGLRPTGELATL